MSGTHTRVEWLVRWSWSVYWFDTEEEARNYVKDHPAYRIVKRTVTDEDIT